MNEGSAINLSLSLTSWTDCFNLLIQFKKTVVCSRTKFKEIYFFLSETKMAKLTKEEMERNRMSVLDEWNEPGQSNCFS